MMVKYKLEPKRMQLVYPYIDKEPNMVLIEAVRGLSLIHISEEYSGLAFGIGIERLAMLKYGINNIKLLYQSDMRVLDQINDD